MSNQSHPSLPHHKSPTIVKTRKSQIPAWLIATCGEGVVMNAMPSGKAPEVFVLDWPTIGRAFCPPDRFTGELYIDFAMGKLDQCFSKHGARIVFMCFEGSPRVQRAKGTTQRRRREKEAEEDLPPLPDKHILVESYEPFRKQEGQIVYRDLPGWADGLQRLFMSHKFHQIQMELASILAMRYHPPHSDCELIMLGAPPVYDHWKTDDGQNGLVISRSLGQPAVSVRMHKGVPLFRSSMGEAEHSAFEVARQLVEYRRSLHRPMNGNIVFVSTDNDVVALAILFRAYISKTAIRIFVLQSKNIVPPWDDDAAKPSKWNWLDIDVIAERLMLKLAPQPQLPPMIKALNVITFIVFAFGSDYSDAFGYFQIKHMAHLYENTMEFMGGLCAVGRNAGTGKLSVKIYAHKMWAMLMATYMLYVPSVHKKPAERMKLARVRTANVMAKREVSYSEDWLVRELHKENIRYEALAADRRAKVRADESLTAEQKAEKLKRVRARKYDIPESRDACFKWFLRMQFTVKLWLAAVAPALEPKTGEEHGYVQHDNKWCFA